MRLRPTIGRWRFVSHVGSDASIPKPGLDLPRSCTPNSITLRRLFTERRPHAIHGTVMKLSCVPFVMAVTRVPSPEIRTVSASIAELAGGTLCEPKALPFTS